MAWFSSRSRDRRRESALVEEIVELATMRFAVLQHPVCVLDGTSGPDVVLVDGAGRRYPLFNLVGQARAARLADVMRLVIDHVTALVEALQAAPTESLDDADWLEMVRVRLMPAEAAAAIGAEYPARVGRDLVVMLCLDYPTHISYLADPALGGRDVDELVATGLAAVLAEPFDAVTEFRPGVWHLTGESPYTATRALGMQHLVGSVLPAAPHGVIFGTPHRHSIIAHVLDGSDLVQAVSAVSMLVTANAGEGAPGGALSATTYYWCDGVVDEVGSIAGDGTLRIDASGRVGRMLEGAF